ncbi:protein of unknown function [Streptomyces sp. AmelKG-E11A]|nr:protein of unknown function [Streptomyces sp. AmelKG-E11A]
MGAAGGAPATAAGAIAGAPAGAPAGDDAPPLTIPRDPAREAAERELSRPMYHENDPGLFQRALDAFLGWVDDVFSAASGASPGGVVGLTVIVLAAAALIGALWWRLGSPTRTPRGSAPLFDDLPRSAAEHRATADTHAAQGHWTPALQERVRALVRALEERALLDARPGRTADEAAAEAGRPLPGHADRLRAAAHAFDDVTYGGRTADRDTYHRVTALDHDLQRAKPVLTTPAPHSDRPPTGHATTRTTTATSTGTGTGTSQRTGTGTGTGTGTADTPGPAQAPDRTRGDAE